MYLNKSDLYREVIRKLNNIKSGKLDLDDYIEELKSKIKAESASETNTVRILDGKEPVCQCWFETDRLNCKRDCPKRPTFTQS